MQYKYPIEEQLLRWYQGPNAIEMSRSLSTPHFKVYYSETISSALGHEYIQLCANLKFGRKLTQYFFIMYFPSFILTGLSFLNFWIDKKAVPARATLSITSILGNFIQIADWPKIFRTVIC